MKIDLKEDAEQFARFILANYSDASKFTDPVKMCEWYIAYGFIAVVCDDEGEIVALVAARPVERPGLGVLPYYFNEKGICLHVDLLVDISDDTRALHILEVFVRVRFPRCTTIAMFRHFEEHIRVYDIRKFWNSFHKIRRRKKKDYRHETAQAI